MADILGTITRTSNGSNPYTARYANGSPAGNFKTVGEARQPIEQASGGRFIRWTRVQQSGSVESYEATAS